MALIREPTNRFVPGGKLRECDICGIAFHENELVKQDDGYWHCRYDIDVLRSVEEEARVDKISRT